MKLKQIDFDATLIGKEGIVVKTRDGNDVKQLTLFPNCDDWPLVGVEHGKLRTWTLGGREWLEPEDDGNDLFMYRTVKVMTVDEWRQQQIDILSSENKGTYLIYGYYLAVNQLAAATKRGEVEL